MSEINVRAGFWRRWFSTLLDIVLVWLPFQMLVAVLFASTSGHVQISSGLVFKTCAPVQHLPADLAPPPPEGSNFARECRFSLFGAETARRLLVGRVVKEGGVTKSFSQSYSLDRDGGLVDPVSLDWPVAAIFLVYLVALKSRSGQSLGDRALRIALLDTSPGAGLAVPARKILMRYLAMATGLIPVILTTAYGIARYGSLAKAAAADEALILTVGEGLLVLIWAVVNIVLIVTRRDPIYDRLAGTTVERI